MSSFGPHLPISPLSLIVTPHPYSCYIKVTIRVIRDLRENMARTLPEGEIRIRDRSAEISAPALSACAPASHSATQGRNGACPIRVVARTVAMRSVSSAAVNLSRRVLNHGIGSPPEQSLVLVDVSC